MSIRESNLAIVTPSAADYVRIVTAGGASRRALASLMPIGGGSRTYTGGAGIFLKVDGDELDPDVESRDFNFTVASYPGVNGVGVRGNAVARMGWNTNSDGAREDVTDAACYLSWEEHYLDNGDFAFEFHLEGLDESGAPFRPMSFFIPKNGDPIGVAFSVGNFRLYDSSGDIKVELDLDTGDTLLHPGFSLKFGYNNVAPIKQLNAAGTDYLNLPFYNASDRLLLQGDPRCATIKTQAYTVATLPSAVTLESGTRALVTDSNVTTFHAIVAGGGANIVPVFSDGTDWRIG